MGFSPDFSLSGKAAYKHVCNAPVDVSVQAVVVWCHMHGHQKKYQQIIIDMLSDCEGVADIADDLVVFSKDTKERDRRLFALLNRLNEVNWEDCEWRQVD